MTRAELERKRIAFEEWDRRIRANKNKSSLFEFVKTFWGVIINEEPVWNWHIEYICEELQKMSVNLIARKPKEYDALINIPPSSTKSTIITIMFPAWLWAIDATLRVISNSYSAGISIDHAIKSRDIILSPLYVELFPDVELKRDRRGKQSYENTQNGSRVTTSTGGSITGKHAHLIINDDAQSPMQANSEAHRHQAVEHTKTLSSRKVDSAVTLTITVMQRLNEKDVSGYLLGLKNKLKHIKLPAEVTENTVPLPEDLDEFKGKPLLSYYKGGLLDAVRITRDSLESAKVSLGTRGYNGQMLQNPVSEDGDIIERKWFEKISKHSFLDLLSKQRNQHIQFFLDTSYTDKTENDPNGIIGTYYIDGVVYIFCAEKVHKIFPDLITWVKEYVVKNNYTSRSMIRVEPKASGLSLIQTLKRQTKLNVTNTPTPKESKTVRLHSIAPVVESRRVVLIEGSWNEDFVDEVAGFPNAANDEYVDVLVYAVAHYTDKKSIKISGNVL